VIGAELTRYVMRAWSSSIRGSWIVRGILDIGDAMIKRGRKSGRTVWLGGEFEGGVGRIFDWLDSTDCLRA
jgi:hypothetical protein